MTVKLRNYQGKEDFLRVSDFLFETYASWGGYVNWIQPRWEYMHYHPALNEEALGKIGIWEDDGQIVAVVTYEGDLGDIFFQIHPEYTHLKREMLDYAEQNLWRNDEKYGKFIAAFVNETDDEMLALVKERGYEKHDQHPEFCSLSQLVIPEPFPEIVLPEGFKLKSLADENDLYKINRVLWRGFNHEGDAPETEEDMAGRIKMQSGPNFRKDLTIVVVAPDGNYVAYAGLWFEAANRICYVEPVATDPDYRKMGLGKAAVLEGIRRCGELGATVAYVESAKDFYKKLGFEAVFARFPWLKQFDK